MSTGDLGFDPENLPSNAGQADFSGVTPEQARSVFEHLSDEEVLATLRRIDGEKARAKNAREVLESIVTVIADIAAKPLRGIL